MRKRAKTLPGVTRRQVLTWSTLGVAATVTRAADAVSLKGSPGWTPFSDNPPETFDQPGWLFFTQEEAETIEAIVDRLIPADELSVGGKEAGCAQFIDRQLHGAYGTFERIYMEGRSRKAPPNRAISLRWCRSSATARASPPLTAMCSRPRKSRLRH
ncbi:gluconate 2-dehydrogenase subunit 3 family protein [Pantoea sp.]|uniref:gluconate 2-dehydrogenase subunit 3 family protein n=1 Tax=Pantoea sp. TaxID=69393 RepID=UPI0028AA2510|nr:gluconate 2-dehydrogenase subunit 3 family protein [Pantoea sp.]